MKSLRHPLILLIVGVNLNSEQLGSENKDTMFTETNLII